MTTQQTRATKANGQVKSYPVARQLATPTDLTQKEVQAITEALNPLVADAFASLLWQGYLLYNQLDGQMKRYEQRVVTQRIAELEQLLRSHEQAKTGYRPIFSDVFNPVAQDFKSQDEQSLFMGLQWEQQLVHLRQQQAQLQQYQQEVLSAHPLLEERREQLAALLGQEQIWLEQRGIALPAQEMQQPMLPEASRPVQPDPEHYWR